MKFRWIAVAAVALLVVIVAVGCGKKEAEQPAAHAHAHTHIEWITDMDQALVKAAETHKPIMIDFMATWCPPCNMMEDSTFHDDRVIHKAESFIAVRIDVDKQGDVANHYKANASKYGGVGIPNILFLDAHGQKLKHPVGYRGPEEFLAIMDSALTMAAHHHH